MTHPSGRLNIFRKPAIQNAMTKGVDAASNVPYLLVDGLIPAESFRKMTVNHLTAHARATGEGAPQALAPVRQVVFQPSAASFHAAISSSC
jgi:hypothetical protein